MSWRKSGTVYGGRATARADAPDALVERTLEVEAIDSTDVSRARAVLGRAGLVARWSGGRKASASGRSTGGVGSGRSLRTGTGVVVIVGAGTGGRAVFRAGGGLPLTALEAGAEVAGTGSCQARVGGLRSRRCGCLGRVGPTAQKAAPNSGSGSRRGDRCPFSWMRGGGRGRTGRSQDGRVLAGLVYPGTGVGGVVLLRRMCVRVASRGTISWGPPVVVTGVPGSRLLLAGSLAEAPGGARAVGAEVPFFDEDGVTSGEGPGGASAGA
jgi:hypothetical protein